ncbi:hypothetical protein TNCV_1517661 [Trichonephila clavipes]|nr:hypothetical protein TNCV_1517661 [Trichonephila clavipes]
MGIKAKLMVTVLIVHAASNIVMPYNPCLDEFLPASKLDEAPQDISGKWLLLFFVHWFYDDRSKRKKITEKKLIEEFEDVAALPVSNGLPLFGLSERDMSQN